MKELIKTYLLDIIRKLAPDFRENVLVEIPENKEYGDYTTNVAFVLSKILKKSPQEIAEYLVSKLEKQKISDFSKIESRNGFVNFYLSENYLYGKLEEILKKKKNYRSPTSITSINIEFISANPTGPLTLGNGRGGFYGDVLANILGTQGYKITREYYINDRGEQILALGRSIKKSQGFESSSIPGIEELAKGEGRIPGINAIGDGNLYKGEYINELAKQIDKKLNAEEAGQKAAELILKTYIKPIIKMAGMKFDNWFSEKTLYAKGGYEKIMADLMRKNLVYEKDGATWLKTTEFGDNDDRVLIKTSGEETYFTSDILYHIDKIKVRKFDKVIDIWGADHHGYAPRLKAALKALGVSGDSLKIIISQLVCLIKDGKEMKISKRAGNFITLGELIGEVGLDAARFYFLMYSPDTHMDFDIGLAKERSQKNPVYYAQYAHARAVSILRKATSDKRQATNLNFLKEKEELNLIRKLIEFPELLGKISVNYEVHRLPRYSLELAREFHNFYEKCRVITEDKTLTSARLNLVTAIKIVLANALNLMGIKAPDKM